MIPVIAPIGVDESGQTFNINADTMAGAIAAALGASRLFLLTDVAGVLDKDGNLLTDLDPTQIARVARRWHSHRRDDSQAGNLHRGGQRRHRGGGYS